jgi:hypothetical protein
MKAPKDTTDRILQVQAEPVPCICTSHLYLAVDESTRTFREKSVRGQNAAEYGAFLLACDAVLKFSVVK